MIKRKLFFFLDKLQIKRSERLAVTSLFVTLIIMSGFAIIFEPTANYDPDYYAELERVFNEKSQARDLENAEIMARYSPEMDDAYFPEHGFQVATVASEEPSNSSNPEIALSDSIININKATSEQLQQLPGIGPAYAERIIEWRLLNGQFTTYEQLLEIRGIGERRLELIIPFISLHDDDDDPDELE